MSSLLGGDSSSTSTTTVNFPKWIDPQMQAYYKAMLPKIAGLMDTPYEQYTGARTADFNPDEVNSFDMVRNLSGQAGQGINTAMGISAEVANRGLNGFSQDTINQYMNPYMQNVMDISRQRQLDQFSLDRNRLAQQQGQIGSFGGSRAAISQGRLQDTFGRQLAEQEANQLYQGYNDSMNRAFQGTQMAGQAGMDLANQSTMYQNAGLRDAAALSMQGAQQRGMTQQGLDLAYQDWAGKKAYPYQQLEWGANMMNPIAQTLRGQTTTTTQSGGSGILGAALGIGSMMMGVPGIGSSIMGGLGSAATGLGMSSLGSNLSAIGTGMGTGMNFSQAMGVNNGLNAAFRSYPGIFREGGMVPGFRQGGMVTNGYAGYARGGTVLTPNTVGAHDPYMDSGLSAAVPSASAPAAPALTPPAGGFLGPMLAAGQNTKGRRDTTGMLDRNAWLAANPTMDPHAYNQYRKTYTAPVAPASQYLQPPVGAPNSIASYFTPSNFYGNQMPIPSPAPLPAGSVSGGLPTFYGALPKYYREGGMVDCMPGFANGGTVRTGFYDGGPVYNNGDMSDQWLDVLSRIINGPDEKDKYVPARTAVPIPGPETYNAIQPSADDGVALRDHTQYAPIIPKGDVGPSMDKNYAADIEGRGIGGFLMRHPDILGNLSDAGPVGKTLQPYVDYMNKHPIQGPIDTMAAMAGGAGVARAGLKGLGMAWPLVKAAGTALVKNPTLGLMAASAAGHAGDLVGDSTSKTNVASEQKAPVGLPSAPDMNDPLVAAQMKQIPVIRAAIANNQAKAIAEGKEYDPYKDTSLPFSQEQIGMALGNGLPGGLLPDVNGMPSIGGGLSDAVAPRQYSPESTKAVDSIMKSINPDYAKSINTNANDGFDTPLIQFGAAMLGSRNNFFKALGEAGKAYVVEKDTREDRIRKIAQQNIENALAAQRLAAYEKQVDLAADPWTRMYKMQILKNKANQDPAAMKRAALMMKENELDIMMGREPRWSLEEIDAKSGAGFNLDAAAPTSSNIKDWNDLP